MEIKYTLHSEEAILERKLSKKEIEKAVFSPEKITKTKLGRTIAEKIVGNKLLRVVFEVQGSVYIIITAYYTSPERYK